ncbi:cytochrome bc1 complex Rieske iron-sulfur subunit [Nocardioides flavus (ex Wang et al. 2016)]|uniref:Cytochrome bc1 complex Rieske iron-sulfur subunit n=1 Tax=Nocardioides flavus (ex Wang et al. 2016) TaxID=2058780 RepID=A0ABQ3HKV9_9ACTN|nr:Rieske 2Fe-2S domain-containing protein [Nocardioides flavus (ex Wang et al. 2016)]GHE17302.1 cytochrome bc1 complex Rieske iron-sulfur subunit [Nocardioides flavus (ex Wang et al. 2016)]
MSNDNTPSPYESHVPSHREAEPIPDPGLPAHTWRPTDVDPKAEKRAERQIAAMFVAAMVFAVLFVVAYFSFEIGDSWDTFGGLGASTVTLGLTLGMSLLLIGTGIIQLARKLMADAEMVEMRHPAASPPEDREATIQALNDGLDEAGIGRRPLVRNTMLGAVGVLGLPAVVLLRDLAPGNALDINKLAHTIWEPGMRLVRDVVGTPILASEVEMGDLINAAPEAMFPSEENGYPELEGAEEQAEKAKGAIIIVRMDPSELTEATQPDKWTVDGIICYSKICTHVGCPISLYERTTHHVLCPCHQSTFDLADGAKVVFGPAARALPQLPIAVDEEGYLVAQSDFTEPIGASFWEREKL